MEFERLFRDAMEYTGDTFAGHWTRWLIFAILGLPFSLVPFVVDPRKIVTGTTVHWELIPWRSLAAIVIAGILASFFVSGYLVRIYRGVKPAPEFTGWWPLFTDGIRLEIVILAWFLPAFILMLLLLALDLAGLFFRGIFGGTGAPLAFLLVSLVILILGVVLLVAGVLYGIMGGVRFARTGSMTEGWSYAALTALIRRIGWGNYIIALFLVAIAGALFSGVVSIPAVIPYIGWIIPVILSPLLTVFIARYYMLVYEAGEVPPPAAPAPAP
jgi:hypothetical protein